MLVGGGDRFLVKFEYVTGNLVIVQGFLMYYPKWYVLNIQVY